MHQIQMSTALWSQFRGNAKARSGREHLRGVQILSPDRHQRPGGTAVNDRTEKRGQDDAFTLHMQSSDKDSVYTVWYSVFFVLPVRNFPRGSVPNDSWKPGGHDGSGVAVGN